MLDRGTYRPVAKLASISSIYLRSEKRLAIGIRQTIPFQVPTTQLPRPHPARSELMNLQQTLEGQQPGGVVRVELAEETEDWSL